MPERLLRVFEWTGVLTLVLLMGAALLISCSARAAEYSRDAFGDGWLDLDGDGFDTREEMLALSAITGRGWHGLYSGSLIDDPGRLDIDHVVPLAWAWSHGANAWTRERRMVFANDPLNLLVVHLSANRSKGSRGPDEWMPANVAAWLVYLDRFVTVVHRYGLVMTDDEIRVIRCLRRVAIDHGLGIKVGRFVTCR